MPAGVDQGAVGEVMPDAVIDLRQDDRRSRIWGADLPAAHYPVRRTLRRRATAGAAAGAGRRVAALEVRLPRDAGYYGLLGARFAAGPTGDLVVEVAISDADGPPLAWALAGGEVMAGLPDEYGEAVLAGAFDGAALARLGAGALRFDCAAHGVVGSSRHLFRRLSTGVVRLLAEPTWTDHALAQIIATIH
jgi:hypothetical protein